MTSVSRFMLPFSAAVLLTLTGCSANFSPSPVDSPVGTFRGTVHGGQAPISGAHIYLYAAGKLGYAGPGITASTSNASTSLLTHYTSGSFPTSFDGTNYFVTSDSNGNFSVGGEYTCTVGTQVYLYVVGGNSGGGTNSGIGLLAALGVCPSGGSLASTVPSVLINEVSTVAAAYALAGFATDATHISSGVSSLAATGLSNAFLTVTNLVGVASGGAYAKTPGGNGTVPQSQINSMANSLAACINSTQTGFTNCTTLFGYAKSGGNIGTKPTDTATAMINIAHNPTANVSSIFNIASSTPPFVPFMSAAPNDFSLSITYTGGGLIKPTYGSSPNSLAIDAAGNVWNANYSTTASTLTELSPLGVPANSTGFAVGNGAYSATVDTAGNVWTANYTASTLTKFVPSTTTATTVTPTGLSSPQHVAFDGSGNMFVAEHSSNVLKASSAGVYMSSTTTGQNSLSAPNSVALEPGNLGVWAANGSGKYASFFTNTLTSYLTYNLTSSNYLQAGVAVDAGGNAWVTVYPTSASEGFLEEITTGGAGTSYNNVADSNDPCYAKYDGVAVDGGNNTWLADAANGMIFAFSNSGALLSGTYGFTAAGNPITTSSTSCSALINQPQSVQIDGSGNVWYNMLSDNTVRELIGIATPTITPLSYATAQSTLGTKP